MRILIFVIFMSLCSNTHSVTTFRNNGYCMKEVQGPYYSEKEISFNTYIKNLAKDGYTNCEPEWLDDRHDGFFLHCEPSVVFFGGMTLAGCEQAKFMKEEREKSVKRANLIVTVIVVVLIVSLLVGLVLVVRRVLKSRKKKQEL